MTYETIQGDTWDQIAKNVYGDETLTGLLMEANFAHLDTLVFSGGVTLTVPDKPALTNASLPPWRR